MSDDELRFLKGRQFRTLVSAAEVIIPAADRGLSPEEIGRRADAFLGSFDSPVRSDLGSALFLIEYVVPLRFLKLGLFSRLSESDRRDLIERMVDARGLLRDVTRILKILVTFIHYADADVRRGIGYVDVDDRPRLDGVDRTPRPHPDPRG